MSPMRSLYQERPRTATIFLIILFLVADLALPSSFEGWKELEDQQIVHHTISSHGVHADTYITAASATSTYNTSTTGTLAEGTSLDSRLLLRFPMNFTSSDTIHEASIELQCTTAATGSTRMLAYVGTMNRMWNGSYANWNSWASALPWSATGAEGSADRGAWEPPTELLASGTLSLNVTRLAQVAARSNSAYLSVIVSSIGAAYTCDMSESSTSSNRPALVIDSSSGAASSGGVVSPLLPIPDGAPWMESDFLLTPVTTPTLSYDSNTGQEVEMQLSNSPSWRSSTDDDWHFSTLWSSFSTSGATGSYALPSSLALVNGTTMFMRVRSMDANDQWGAWAQTSFLLPALDVVDNGDGTATLTLSPTGTSLEKDFIQDATVNEVSKTVNAGGATTTETSMTSTKEKLIHFRASLNQLGLHDNLTILNAELTLIRSSYTGSPVVSVHGMEESGLWVENEITWNKMSSNGISWYDGGRSNGTQAFDLADGTQSSNTFTFDLNHAVQNYLDNGDEDPLDMMIAVRGKYESYTNGEGIVFHSAEAASSSNQPSFTLTYEWGSGSPPAAVTLTSPLGGLAIWNQTGHNLSGNTQPSLNWTAPSTGDDLIFELATDEDFRLRTMHVDTRVDNDFAPTDGIINMTGANTLDVGNMYFWRMASVDSDGHYGMWSSSSFFISELESTYLGGDRYEFRIRHGNGSIDNQYPSCIDTYIDSSATTDNFDGDSEMTVDYNLMGSEITSLIGCNLLSNLLPDGYAVESAQLQLTLTSSTLGTPVVAVWENLQHNWSAEDATWSSFDGTNSWQTAGAKGTERGSLLDSVSIGSSYGQGDVVEWNVTLAVQNAMREERRIDFIAGLLGVGSGNSRTAYFSTAEDSESNRPQLSFVYVPGSNAVPNDPVPSTPANGSWSIGSGVDLTPVTRPELSWTFGGTMSIAGYLVQLDTQEDFSSVNTETYSSWNDAGFDVTNLTFTPTQDLNSGTTWYWRVRAVSATNQIGNWSNIYHFQVPDLETYVFNSTKASVVLEHHGALPSLSIPHFIDTTVIENGVGADSTHENDTGLGVGQTTSGYQSAALLRLPLSEIPQPSNARVTGATLSVFAEYGSPINEPVAIRPVLRSWTTAANATTYDGVNAWSMRGGRGIGSDIGNYIDLVDSVSDGWMEFDITEAVQVAIASGQTHVSLMLYTSTQTTNLITFTSTEGSASERPTLNLTWETGAVATPTVSGVNAAPATGTIVWDTTTHAVMGDHTPTFSWTYSGSTTVTDWRLFMLEDASNDMAGLRVFDSRVDASEFDLTNLTFTPTSDITFTQQIRWMVQPINNGMLGPRGSSTNFYIPNNMGSELDSTHATLVVQEGALIPSLSYPSVTQDTYLDSGNTLANVGSSSAFYVGLSPISNNGNLRSSSLISIDFSNLPLPTVYEITDARLDLSALGVYQQTFITASQMSTNWTESSVWAYPAGNTSSWLGSGAYHSADAEAPFNAGVWVNSTGTVSFNITGILQKARDSGLSKINLILQAEEVGGSVAGRVQFASSEDATISNRPRLNITYELTNAWVASPPTNLLPLDGSTLWDLNEPRPSGQNTSEYDWSAGFSNQTRWVTCWATNARMVDDLECYSSDSIEDGDYPNLGFDAVNLTLTRENQAKGDQWLYWRVRADQNERIGEWSAVQRYRIPEDQGSDDGNGNHTVELSRGSIFSLTGLLPSVPDVEIDSNSTVNKGGATTMVLGTNGVGTGESQILMSFDFTNIPWPAAITPTRMVLRMYQTAVGGTASTTVGVYACSGFSESTVVWANKPTCSTTEITRSTLTISSPSGWMEWDLTSLAQANLANGNTTMTFVLKRIGTTGSSHTFYSAEATGTTYDPYMVFEYVDNVNGILPPAQPVLVSPADGDVLYDDDGGMLVPAVQPVLSWQPVSGATGYIVTLSNSSGIYTYRSWEDSEITNTSFRFSDDLSAGQMITWWVKAVNQSIPGPASSRWSFAVGDPHQVNNYDHTFSYTLQTGNEVAELGHTNIQDTDIKSEYATANFGSNPLMSTGTWCGTLYTDQCRLTVALDASQIPFPPYQQVHSAALGLYVESWTSALSATSVTFSVHPILNGMWSQTSATWNGTTGGATWGSPGMQSGVDYGPAVSTSVVNVNTAGWIWFDVSTAGMTTTSQQAWIIRATPNTGYAHATFYTSDALQLNIRPKILLNTTNITSISISPTGSVSTDADTPVNFNSVAYDHQSMVQTVPVSWSVSAGSVGTNGLFSPTTSGVQTVKACFGLVCGSQAITVSPGVATDLLVTPLTATITADQTLTITAAMVDQHGNAVPGEPITFTPTNGSMSSVMPNVFQPYAVGTFSIRVQHAVTSGEYVDVSVTVTKGAPAYFELSGCTGVVPAGVWCDISADLYDQFGNPLDISDAGNLTWTMTDGSFSEINQQYFPDHVGVWWLNVTSVSGASDALMITVGHGAMDHLELEVSSNAITADDRVYINTTRVDVRGNRLTVLLPRDNWTRIADGQITPGAPAIWDPTGQGAKIIEARYETTFASVTITVDRGVIQTLRIEVDDEIATWADFDITADETLDAEVFAIDAKGNQWSVIANWTLTHPTMGDSSEFLEILVADTTTFTPYYASQSAYTMSATYFDGLQSHTVGINITVSPGFLKTVTIYGIANNPSSSTGDKFEVTADYAVDFSSDLFDADDNSIDAESLTWLEVNVATGQVRDITTQLLLNDMRWEATRVGKWTIQAYSISGNGFNVSDSITITVLHGIAISVNAEATLTSLIAGESTEIQVTGTDADGNQFAQNVDWTENGGIIPTLSVITTSDGYYIYEGRIAGIHTLSYVSVSSQPSTLEISVTAQSLVAKLEVNLSTTSLEQLETLDLQIRAFDAFNNEIDVPGSVKVETTGRATATMIASNQWTIKTLDDGTQTITVSVGAVRVNSEITVIGNLNGFFEAGGTLYYVGAVLLGIVAVVLLVLLVMFFRSSASTNYDDDDDEDEDDDDERPRGPSGKAPGPASGPTGPAPGPSGPAPGPSGPAPGPSGPAPGPSGPAPAEVEETPAEEAVEPMSEQPVLETKTDEDGTEWWEDGDGVWWYKLAGEEEWHEYSQ